MKTKTNLNSYHSVKHLYLQYNLNLNLKAETIKILKKKLYRITLSELEERKKFLSTQVD